MQGEQVVLAVVGREQPEQGAGDDREQRDEHADEDTAAESEAEGESDEGTMARIGMVWRITAYG